MPTAQASTGNRPDSQWQKKKIAAAAGSCKTMSNTSNRSVVRCCGWRMLALLLASLPSQPPPPRLQSMAASVHGSANIRCVSSPSGGLSSRRAYLSSRCSFFFFFRGLERGGYFGTDQAFSISFDSSLGYLRSGLIISRGVRNDDDHK